jgi:glucose-6-phosphate isomerase
VAQLLLDGPRTARVCIVDFDDAAAEGELASIDHLRRIERDATYQAMSLPSSRMLVRDRTLTTLGGLFVEGMMETVLVAEVWGISPYGQPAVERIKQRVDAARRPGGDCGIL